MRNKILISLGVIMIFSVFLISAVSFNLPKPQTCLILNMSGLPCDIFWCEQVLGYNWSLADGFCIKTQVLNQTLIFNDSYYNRTEIDNLFLNYSINSSSSNLVNRTELIDVKNSILEVQENRTKELINAYLPDSSNEGSGSSVPPYVFVVGIIAVVIILLFFGYQKMTEAKRKANNPIPTVGFKRKINPLEDTNINKVDKEVVATTYQGKPLTKEEIELMEKIRKISETEKKLLETKPKTISLD
jgi:hypothetical protein